MSSSKAEGPVTLMPERRMWLTVNGSEEMSVFLSGPDTDVDLFVTLLIETPSTAAEFKDVAKSSINVYNQAGVRLTPRQVLPATDEVLKVCFSKPMATKTRLDPG